MGWFESARSAVGLRSNTELARKVRNASPGHAVGVESLARMLNGLSAHYTPGYTPIESWYDGPLLWWIQRPEYVEGLVKVLGSEIKPFMEAYWVARLAWLTPDVDSPAAVLRQLQERSDELRANPHLLAQERWSVLLGDSEEVIGLFPVSAHSFPVPGDVINVGQGRYEVVGREWTLGEPTPRVRVFKVGE